MTTNTLTRVSVSFVSVLIATATGRAQMTAEERQEILSRHNTERCAVSPAAQAMPALVWDETLARVAQAHAERCVFAHNARSGAQYRALGGAATAVGENIAAGHASVAALVQMWADEKPEWMHDRPGTSGTGHYTQMIWAATTRIGCGAAICDSLARPRGRPLAGVRFLVCDYAPAGNHVGRRPYVAGPGTNAACPGAGVTGSSRD